MLDAHTIVVYFTRDHFVLRVSRVQPPNFTASLFHSFVHSHLSCERVIEFVFHFISLYWVIETFLMLLKALHWGDGRE